MRKKEKTPFVNLLMFVMLCAIFVLGFKINEKKQWIHLPPINTWLPYEKWFMPYDNRVDASITYHHLIDNVYTNGTNQSVSLMDGIILEIQENQVTILHDNGVQIIYGRLDDIVVQVDERILKGQSIGVFDDSLTLDITKDQKKITLEEAQKL